MIRDPVTPAAHARKVKEPTALDGAIEQQFRGTVMRLCALESCRNWRATFELQNDGESRAICLMSDRIGDGHYWFIADFEGELPWQAVLPFQPAEAVQLIAMGKLRLVRGWLPAELAQRVS